MFRNVGRYEWEEEGVCDGEGEGEGEFPAVFWSDIYARIYVMH